MGRVTVGKGGEWVEGKWLRFLMSFYVAWLLVHSNGVWEVMRSNSVMYSGFFLSHVQEIMIINLLPITMLCVSSNCYWHFLVPALP